MPNKIGEGTQKAQNEVTKGTKNPFCAFCVPPLCLLCTFPRFCWGQASSACRRKSFQDRRYRIPIARCGRNPNESFDLTEIRDCLHPALVKTEEESISATDDSHNPFAVTWKLQWSRRQSAWRFR